MKSFQLCRIFGIRVKAHVSFLILPLFFGFLYGKDHGFDIGVRAFVLVILVFACVLGHELSHSVMARRLGVSVPEINLYLIGGVASMQRIPREPSREFLISIVGPFFNFVLAAVLYYPMLALMGPRDLFSPSLDTWPRTFANVFWANPVLGAFNLLPAFPMDGGRILRAALAGRLDYPKATAVAVFLGHFFAILLALLGIWRHHWMLLLVAVFVFTSASAEMAHVRYEEYLRRRIENG